ncbi:MAG: sel1 repeat family protein, partial [Gammaproteobacteria bacterium]|nr:sel1 repeat family protein [Gammaproteobacteria bacterium]
MYKQTLFDEAVAARDRGDYALARRLFEQGAKEGHPYGLVLLASMYIEGHGTPVNLQKAEELLMQAESLGVLEAVLQRANLWHSHGDMKKHFAALQQGARQGSLAAQYRVGICYARGIGVEKDREKALAVMKEASADGHLGRECTLARRLLA